MKDEVRNLMHTFAKLTPKTGAMIMRDVFGGFITGRSISPEAGICRHCKKEIDSVTYIYCGLCRDNYATAFVNIFDMYSK